MTCQQLDTLVLIRRMKWLLVTTSGLIFGRILSNTSSLVPNVKRQRRILLDQLDYYNQIVYQKDPGKTSL